jgi:hypothetical protein
MTKPSPETCAHWAAEIRLLRPSQLRRRFPDGELVRERALGLTKSLIVMRRR